MLTLHGVRYRLASDSLNSVELVQRLLPQIEASQPTLHAFTVVLAESALAEARAADARRAAGDTSPLLGVPIAVSDEIDVAGVATTFGTAARLQPAGADAEVVRRLRAAGAIIMGKTAAGELGQQLRTTGLDGPWCRTLGGRGIPRGPTAEVRRRQWRRVWFRRRSAPTAVVDCESPLRGQTSWASNRNAAASPPGRCRSRFTDSPPTVCWPAPSRMLPWSWMPCRGMPTVICTSHRRCESAIISASRLDS